MCIRFWLSELYGNDSPKKSVQIAGVKAQEVSALAKTGKEHFDPVLSERTLVWSSTGTLNLGLGTSPPPRRVPPACDLAFELNSFSPQGAPEGPVNDF